MVNNMDHGLPKFSLLGYDDWKIMMEAHLYALHDCMWMVLEDGPLKIQMENPEKNPETPDVVQYIPKPKENGMIEIAKSTIWTTSPKQPSSRHLISSPSPKSSISRLPWRYGKVLGSCVRDQKT
ncbi:unnamed protein product [Cuscuta campestris]|uniref:Uncharacterized protein n=1 Tax=Cuscuta campestris TaxID=132261 RepID=A0A484N8A9_9ASTE|nr:unnamed protein product [Cuscuta campestris]